MKTKWKNVNIGVTDIDASWHFAKKEAIDLTIVGPDKHRLVIVVVRRVLRKEGLAIFGQRACRQHNWKALKPSPKNFLARHNIPNSGNTQLHLKSPLLCLFKSKVAPIVVKADGLAAGKGVFAQTKLKRCEAVEVHAAKATLFGDAGRPCGYRRVFKPAKKPALFAW